MKKVGFINMVLRFLEPALHDKPKLFLFSGIFILWKVYEFINVYVFSMIVSSITTQNYDRFMSLLVYFIVFIIIYQVINYYYHDLFGFYELAMYRHINQKYLPRLIAIENNYIESLGSGKVMTIFTKGMDFWSQFSERVITQSVGMISILGFTLYMLSSVSWQYFIVLLSIGLLFNCFALLFRNFGLQHRFAMYDLIADYNRHVLRYIMSKQEIMQNNRGESEAKSIVGRLDEIDGLSRKNWVHEHLSYNSIEVGIVFVKVATMYGVGRLVFGNQVTIAEFVGVVTLLGYLSSATQSFIDMIKHYMKNGVNLRRFWDFLDNAPKIHNLYVGKSYVHTRGDIKIQDITYAYEKKNIFENFTLYIDGGKKTAFVGASGSGKTTLIKLIAGYLSPQQGDVCIDNNCLSETKLIEYYKKIGYLTQEPSIFDGTVYENLIYALDEIPDKELIHQVIRDAKCEFINEFPDGVATEIGERGIRLSGGQRQRLAIAKIMLKNPDIVLLDEPTSALDSFNEEQISIALHNLFRGKTIIIVAHRLQTVKNADQILVFEDGKVVEQGSHDELVRLGARYNRLLELQSGF